MLKNKLSKFIIIGLIVIMAVILKSNISSASTGYQVSEGWANSVDVGYSYKGAGNDDILKGNQYLYCIDKGGSLLSSTTNACCRFFSPVNTFPL